MIGTMGRETKQQMAISVSMGTECWTSEKGGINNIIREIPYSRHKGPSIKAVRAGGGGSRGQPKADTPNKKSDFPNTKRGQRGGGSKFSQNVRTSFMDGP